MGKKILLTSAIIIGIFLRIYQIEEIPAGLFADEVSLAVNAKTIAQNGTDEYGRHFPFAFESFSDYKMPGYIYAAAISYTVLGSQILAIRLPALLGSMLSILFIGYFAYLLFPKKTYLPFIAAAILALSPYHIHFSRIAFETMLATTFLLLYLIALIQSISTGKKLWYVIGAIALFISSWTYPAPRFIIPVFTLSLLLVGVFVKPVHVPKKRLFFVSLGFLVLSLLSLIPTLLNPLLDKRPLGYLLDNGKGSILEVLFAKGATTASSWLRIFNLEFLFNKGDIFGFRHGTKESGIFLSIFLFPFLVGVLYSIKEFSKKNFSWIVLLLLIIICGLPSSLTANTPYGPRLLPMIIPLTLLVALGVETSMQYLGRKKSPLFGIVSFILLLIFLYQIAWFSHIYFLHFRRNSIPEFPQASTVLGKYLNTYHLEHPKQTIFFLTGKSCSSWGHDDLHFWYFANLDNKEMITWNNMFREKRFKQTGQYGAYESISIPSYTFDHITLFPGDDRMIYAPSGTLLVRCGIQLKDISKEHEAIKKVIYDDSFDPQNPFYVVSEKL